MSFDINKTVCVVFNPSASRNIFSRNFSSFAASYSALKFMNQFTYFGNIITQNMRDNVDMTTLLGRLSACLPD